MLTEIPEPEKGCPRARNGGGVAAAINSEENLLLTFPIWGPDPQLVSCCRTIITEQGALWAMAFCDASEQESLNAPLSM